MPRLGNQEQIPPLEKILRNQFGTSVPKAERVHSSARGPCPRLPPRAPEPPSPYLETQKATEASKSLQTPSSDRTRCPHSCQGTRRLSRGLRSAETRGTHGPGAPPSPRLCSRCRLRKGGRIGAQVGSDGSEVRPPRRWHLGSLGSPQTWPEPSRIQGREQGGLGNLGDEPERNPNGW